MADASKDNKDPKEKKQLTEEDIKARIAFLNETAKRAEEEDDAIIKMGQVVSHGVESILFGFINVLLFVANGYIAFMEAEHLSSLYPERVNPFGRILATTFIQSICTIALPFMMEHMFVPKLENGLYAVDEKTHKIKTQFSFVYTTIVGVIITFIIGSCANVLTLSYAALNNEVIVAELKYEGKEDMLIQLSWGLVISALVIDLLLGLLAEGKRRQKLRKKEVAYVIKRYNQEATAALEAFKKAEAEKKAAGGGKDSNDGKSDKQASNSDGQHKGKDGANNGNQNSNDSKSGDKNKQANNSTSNKGGQAQQPVDKNKPKGGRQRPPRKRRN